MKIKGLVKLGTVALTVVGLVATLVSDTVKDIQIERKIDDKIDEVFAKKQKEFIETEATETNAEEKTEES